jgi:hypothetical protein
MEVVSCDGRIIAHADKKLLIFHLVDVVGKYDTVMPNTLDTITLEDIYLANVIVARTPRTCWRNVIGKSIADIPRDSDLILMSEPQWEVCKSIVRAVLSPFLLEKGIACAVLTKALHRKRPRLLPICDGVVIKFLGVTDGKKDVETIVGCMDRVRDIGKRNRSTIESIEKFLNQWRMPRLSKVRMIDALCWMEGSDRYQRLWSAMEARDWQLPSWSR